MNVIPLEPPLPPPTPPVLVTEGDSSRRPIQDRELLADCIHSLANKLSDALEQDRLENNRYARRLRLINYVNFEHRSRSEYLVVLPLDVYCWNEVDLFDIELRLLRTVIEEAPEDQVWFNMSVEFDQFFDEEVRQCIYELDHPGDTSTRTTEAQQAQPSDNQPQYTHEAMDVGEPASVELITCDDSDDEIQIIGSIEPRR